MSARREREGARGPHEQTRLHTHTHTHTHTHNPYTSTQGPSRTTGAARSWWWRTLPTSPSSSRCVFVGVVYVWVGVGACLIMHGVRIFVWVVMSGWLAMMPRSSRVLPTTPLHQTNIHLKPSPPAHPNQPNHHTCHANHPCRRSRRTRRVARA